MLKVMPLPTQPAEQMPEGHTSCVPREKYAALARAFENVNLERTHWRKQAERLRALIEQMQQHMKPYEGE